jgi:alkanesulfonate monooxygenase SsuD/methylene tetrahydromethanopterin reductase-like flavin-dependent oxidoreductase (luciferase family)
MTSLTPRRLRPGKRAEDKGGRDYYNYYVHVRVDREAADNVCRSFGIESCSYSRNISVNFRANFIAGWGGCPPIGTPEQRVELSGTWIDGMLISMVDYNQELPHWNERVMPLLEQAGLRKPQASAQIAAWERA